MALGRDEGADVDDLGIQPVPAEQGPFLAWGSVHDLRVERRGGRAQVAVYLDTGQVSRLRAPYDGRLLAADPEFERSCSCCATCGRRTARSGSTTADRRAGRGYDAG